MPEHCCPMLRANLGNSTVEPTPAYITQANMDRYPSWYPGVTSPGYYGIWRKDSAEVDEHFYDDSIEYRPLATCPYCHVELGFTE